MTHKTTEISGALLDAAVANSEGLDWEPNAQDGTLEDGIIVLADSIYRMIECLLAIDARLPANNKTGAAVEAMFEASRHAERTTLLLEQKKP